MPDCSSPSSHRRGHPCRKLLESLLVSFPESTDAKRNHELRTQVLPCCDFSISYSPVVPWICGSFCLALHPCTSIPFQIDMACVNRFNIWVSFASAWCPPCVATNLRNKFPSRCTSGHATLEEFTSRSPPNGSVYTPHENGSISPAYLTVIFTSRGLQNASVLSLPGGDHQGLRHQQHHRSGTSQHRLRMFWWVQLANSIRCKWAMLVLPLWVSLTSHSTENVNHEIA